MKLKETEEKVEAYLAETRRICEEAFSGTQWQPQRMYLAPCARCGAPSFGQPCVHCNFYPIPQDRKVSNHEKEWHQTSFENFKARVGRYGNIFKLFVSTWHWLVAYNKSSEFRRITHQVNDQAEALEAPTPEEIWYAVKGEKPNVARDN